MKAAVDQRNRAEVTAVVMTRHLDLARSLGADHVIDYTRQDYTRIDETFDFILDAVGKASYFQCRRLLEPQGVFATTDLGPRNQNALLLLWGTISRRRRVVLGMPKSGRDLVEFLKARLQAGDLHAVVDRRYPLEAIVDAYRYVEAGQKTGIVVIDVAQANPRTVASELQRDA